MPRCLYNFWILSLCFDCKPANQRNSVSIPYRKRAKILLFVLKLDHCHWSSETKSIRKNASDHTADASGIIMRIQREGFSQNYDLIVIKVYPLSCCSSLPPPIPRVISDGSKETKGESCGG